MYCQIPDILDNAYVIVEFDNGSRGMLDLCMFAEGSKNEQEISVVGDIGKVKKNSPHPSTLAYMKYFPLYENANVCKIFTSNRVKNSVTGRGFCS